MALDRDGALRDVLIGEGYLTLTTDPPGAEVFAFRYRELSEIEEHGARRLVPVPLGGAQGPALPGALALRVARGAGTLAAEDVVVAVDGEDVTRANVQDLRARATPGTTVAVGREGERRDVQLPAGVELRPTAAPLVVGAGCRLGVTPLIGTRLEPGSFVALVRAPGHETRRVVFALGPGAPRAARTLAVRLFPEGTSPPGFVLVEGCGSSAVGTDAPNRDVDIPRRWFWIVDREVTCAEYVEFLNDPGTLAEIDASPVPLRFPRDPRNAAGGGYWPRGADGRYAIDGEWDPEWPAIGVAYDDAAAYARWFARRLGRDDLEIGLPTFREWVVAGEGSADRDYVFGNVFWPGWVSSCFSQPQPAVEPVLSYPIDESPMGVLDMSGSAAEWLDDWWGTGNVSRRLGGGSWAQARRDLFKVSGGSGESPTAAGAESGFRLVARWREEGAR